MSYLHFDETAGVVGGIFLRLVILQHAAIEAEEAQFPGVGEEARAVGPVFEQVATSRGVLTLPHQHLQ